MGSTLVSAMVARGYRVSVLTNAKKHRSKSFYEVPENTPIIYTRWIDTRRCRRHIRKAIVSLKPDIVIAMTVGAAARWWPHIMRGTGIPFIISEHSNPWIIEKEMWDYHERQLVLSCADGIHLLLPSYINSVNSELHDRVTPISNPLEPDMNTIGGGIERQKILLAVGRLEDDVKQFSLLIDAFGLLTQEFPDWKLKIVGGDVDGSLEKYQRQIGLLDIEEKIELTGVLRNLEEVYMSSSILCHPARYEGFGLVVIEGYRYGLPAVGFRECSGINELIIDNVTGLLVNKMTREDLAGQLGILMGDEQRLSRMRLEAINESKKYAANKIVDMWIRLIEKTIRGGKDMSLLDEIVQKGDVSKEPILRFLQKKYLNDTSILRKVMKEFYTLLLVITRRLIRVEF